MFPFTLKNQLVPTSSSFVPYRFRSSSFAVAQSFARLFQDQEEEERTSYSGSRNLPLKVATSIVDTVLRLFTMENVENDWAWNGNLYTEKAIPVEKDWNKAWAKHVGNSHNAKQQPQQVQQVQRQPQQRQRPNNSKEN